MHTTLESAKHSAERLRTQGSVFTIREQPAILFRSKSGWIVVTEINSKRPLSGYSADAVANEVMPDKVKIQGARDNYISAGAPVLGVALSFDPSSRFWRQRPPPKNSVIVVASERSDLVLAPIPRRKLQLLTSYSMGGGYRLGWRERENDIDSKALKAIEKQQSVSVEAGSEQDSASSPLSSNT